MNTLIITFSIFSTIGAYLIGKWVHNRWQIPFLIPIVIATILLVSFILIFSIPYETYMLGGKWLHELLNPAVVALAYPLYKYRMLIKRKAKSIMIGTFIGAVVGILSGTGLALLVKMKADYIYSLAPKSVTTPVAMEVSETIGGISTLTAVLVIIAGMTGAIFTPYLFKFFKIKTPIARGIGIGTAAHGIGTARAFEFNSEMGTFSSLAMILSTIFVSVFTPIIMQLIL